MNADTRYSDLVVRHFDSPVHVGPLDGDPSGIVTGRAGRRELGVQIRFDARIRDGIVREIAFQAYGCPHVVAACSLAAERLAGAAVDTLGRFDPEVLIRDLGVPVEKTGRMLIVQDALHDCFRDWENRRLAGK